MLDSLRQEAVRKALEECAPFAAGENGFHGDRLASLEASAEGLWASYLRHLEECCRRRGVRSRLLAWMDRSQRTATEEYMDRKDFPEPDRERTLEDLHRVNTASRTYASTFKIMRPILAKISEATGRAPRILDLASGYGGFTIFLAEASLKEGLPLDITSSDLRDHLVQSGRERAAKAGCAVSFRVVDATNMQDLEKGEYDLITVLQSFHHFRAGGLARLIAESARVARFGIIGTDFVRAPWVPPAIALFALFHTRDWYLACDSFLSGRRMYDYRELDLIARAAAPGAKIRCERVFYALTSLVVETGGR